MINVDFESALGGLFLGGCLAVPMARSFWERTRKVEQPAGNPPLESIGKTLDEVRDLLKGVRVSTSVSSELQDSILKELRSNRFDFDLTALGDTSESAVRMEELLGLLVTDSKYSRRKFDALHELLGIDERKRAAEAVENDPDNSGPQFDALVDREMLEQGLTYSAAVSTVKARFAHRRR